MKDRFSSLLSDKSWLVKDQKWTRHGQTVSETQLSLGNGDLGLRSILEEGPVECVPGTYMAGLYDKTAAQATEIVNLPNPLNFKISVNGEKLGIPAMDHLSHQRTLDMKQGILTRQTVYQDSKRNKYDYQSVRFVSWNNPKIIAFRIYFTPLNKTAEITVKQDIDAGVHNRGVLTEGRKRHFQISHVFQSTDHDFLCVRTLEKGIFVAYASSLIYQIGRKKVTTGDFAFNLKVKKGETVCFTKIIAIDSSREPYSGLVERSSRDALETALRLGFDKLLDNHRKAFSALWKSSDIAIKGPIADQIALRFNLYHLMICSPRKMGEASIGAKGLNGEGYRGHIFWDSESFMVPFFIFTFPAIARNMLLYRYNRLLAAQQNAQKSGYKGAQFPWESADSGEECTPDWAKNFDGRIIKVRTGQWEHHIVGDIAFAVNYYYTVTGDEDFMLRYGYELLFETARFWASRVTYNKKRKTYDIKRVIGPDEFHEGVNNNAFTNLVAQWNLMTACRMYHKFKRERKMHFLSLSKEMNLKPSEIKNWSEISRKIFMNIRKDGIIEQFEGYFKKKRVKINAYDDHGMPAIPVGLDLSHISKTQFVKQADVVMAMHLFWSVFSKAVKKKNYAFYQPRTLHKSSLSPSVSAAIGNEIGDQKKAYDLFQAALNVDLKDVRGGLVDGIHAASLGGVWQAVFNGFAGIRLTKELLNINPKLPTLWKSLSLSFYWKGHPIKVQINKSQLKIWVNSKKKPVKIPAFVYGEYRYLSSTRVNVIKRPQK